MNFGEKLKKLRKGKYSQEELAALLKIHANTISKWESGAMEPRSKRVRQLAQIFNTTTAYLLGEADEPSPIVAKKVGNIESSSQVDIHTGQLLIEDKGSDYKNVSADCGVLEYDFGDGRKLKMPDTPSNQEWFRNIVMHSLSQSTTAE